MAGGSRGKDHDAVTDDFTDWSDFPDGHVKDKINQKFEGSDAGDYTAVLVRVKNPISGHKIIKGPKA
jgi:hypothetical protein